MIKPTTLDTANSPTKANASEETLRLGFLTGQYPRRTDTFIQREVAELRALGHHVQTFSVRVPFDKVGAEILAERASTIYLLPPRALIAAHIAQVLSCPKEYFSALALAWKICPPGMRAMARQVAYFAEAAMLLRMMKKLSLSHLHNHFADSCCSVAMIAAAMGGITYSFTVHGPSEFYEAKLWRIDEKVRRALFVNCISHFCRSQVMLFSPLDCWHKLRIVHCGVDPDEFEVKRHEGHADQLLFVGRLTAVKGLPVLFEVVARLRDVTIFIAGDGPDRKLLEEKVQALKISSSVKFLGHQSRGQVRELLKRSDIFVMSSFAEGVPVALMEAMAAGVPVVATRIAGVPELVDDGRSGLLVAPGDVNEMVTALRRLLGDADLRNRLASAARLNIEREFNTRAETRWFARIASSAMAGGSVGIRP